MVSIVEIVSGFQERGNPITLINLLIVSNYMLGLISGNNCFYLFDFHSKDKTGQVSVTGKAALLKFETCIIFDNYIRTVYHSNYLVTMSLQIQFCKSKF